MLGSHQSTAVGECWTETHPSAQMLLPLHSYRRNAHQERILRHTVNSSGNNCQNIMIKQNQTLRRTLLDAQVQRCPSSAVMLSAMCLCDCVRVWRGPGGGECVLCSRTSLVSPNFNPFHMLSLGSQKEQICVCVCVLFPHVLYTHTTHTRIHTHTHTHSVQLYTNNCT